MRGSCHRTITSVRLKVIGFKMLIFKAYGESQDVLI